MKQHSIIRIIIREFKRIRERKTLFLLEIVFPVIIFFLFAEIYESEVIRELPVAVCDLDNSELSRTLKRFIDSSPTIEIEENINSIEGIKSAFQKGRIQGAFVFPGNFEKDIKSGKSSTVTVYKNSTNILVSNYLLKESLAIVKTANGGALLKKLKSSGLTTEKAMVVVNPIQVKTASLYNTTYSYENYLMPGLVTFTLQMLVMLAAVIVLSSEYTDKSFNELVNISERSAYKILIGKSIPHLLLHFTMIILIVGVIFPLYNITIKGSVFTLYLLLADFIIASFMIGLLISTLINDQILATEIAVFINTPAFIFSGFTFPIWGMPFIHVFFAKALPFTHFLNAFLNIYQIGAPISSITNELMILGLFGLISILGILYVLKVKINKQKQSLPLGA